MVTIKEIADKAGVSRGTVDRVLHDRGRVDPQKEQEIRKIARELGYQPNIAAKGLAARKLHLKIGFIYLDLENAPFQRQVYRGALEYAKTLSPYNVEVIFLPITEQDFTKWKAALLQLLKTSMCTDDMDGYALPGILSGALEEILEEKGCRKIPFVLYNIDALCQQKIAYVGCDYVQSGRLACGLANLMTNGKGRIAITSQDGGNIPSSAERIEGFREELSLHYPDLSITGTVFFDDQAYSENYMEIYLSSLGALLCSTHPDILYLVNPGDYSLCRQIANICPDHKTRIITNDLPEDPSLLKDGSIHVTICQEPEMQGAKALEILFNQLALDVAPESAWYKTNLSIKLIQNL